MGIQHNIDQFTEALETAPEEFGDEVLTPLGRDVDIWFGRTATQEYMQEGPTTGMFSEESEKPARSPANQGPLRKVSSRLARAAQSKFGRGGARNLDRGNQETIIGVQEQGIIWLKFIGGTEDLPYAAVHEFGSDGPIRIRTSADMEAFFWAKAFETSPGSVIPDSNAWKHLALAAKSKAFFEINIPARPYARPALEDITPKAVDRAEELIVDFLDERT